MQRANNKCANQPAHVYSHRIHTCQGIVREFYDLSRKNEILPKCQGSVGILHFMHVKA